jgi:hypothetical protein
MRSWISSDITTGAVVIAALQVAPNGLVRAGPSDWRASSAERRSTLLRILFALGRLAVATFALHSAIVTERGH